MEQTSKTTIGHVKRGRPKSICVQCHVPIPARRKKTRNSCHIKLYRQKYYGKNNPRYRKKGLCKSCETHQLLFARHEADDMFHEDGVEFERLQPSIEEKEETGFVGFGMICESPDGNFLGFDDVLMKQSIASSALMDAVLSEQIHEEEDCPISCLSIGMHERYAAHLSVMKVIPVKQTSMRVLSLFDGIASGLYVLKEILKLDVEVYFSAEIDKDAIIVQRKWFGNLVIELGCVKEIDSDILESMGKIDLLIGGSPCNDLSVVNPNRKGLHDHTGTGPLFFEFLRIRNFLYQKAIMNGTPFFWMFENTYQMEKKTLLEMSRYLGSMPIMRCATEFLPVRRKRYFWSNIPEITGSHVANTRGKLQDYLMPHRKANVEILPTLTTTTHSQCSGRDKMLPVTDDGEAAHLYINEVELLFGFPVSYTDAGNMSITRRRKLLGKSWCIPVIVDILNPLTDLYPRME